MIVNIAREIIKSKNESETNMNLCIMNGIFFRVLEIGTVRWCCKRPHTAHNYIKLNVSSLYSTTVQCRNLILLFFKKKKKQEI